MGELGPVVDDLAGASEHANDEGAMAREETKLETGDHGCAHDVPH